MPEKITYTRGNLTFYAIPDSFGDDYIFVADFGYRKITCLWRGSEDKDWFKAWMSFIDNIVKE